MSYVSRWRQSAAFSKLTLSGIALATMLVLPSFAEAKTITAVMHSDLRVIDPEITTAYITRDHGYMVYDTLLAMDSSFKVQPQNVRIFIRHQNTIWRRQTVLDGHAHLIPSLLNIFCRHKTTL